MHMKVKLFRNQLSEKYSGDKTSYDGKNEIKITSRKKGWD